jgi:hypothetical protein
MTPAVATEILPAEAAHAAIPEVVVPQVVADAEPAAADLDAVETAAPETGFAERVLPPEPERPFPARRRSIFFDVENTSRAEHIARMLDYLAIDRGTSRTDFVAVGNWRVIGHDTARLLAQRGAQLVHSAPSVGIRDWSDLRIAVGAGVWLAGARPGDIIEIVSDDRAFDAVGDVAASLGIAYRRLSYRALAGMMREEPPAPEPVSDRGADRGMRGRRRGRRRGGWRERPLHAHARPVEPAPLPPAPAEVAPAEVEEMAATNGAGSAPAAGEAHTAPHDEIIAVVRDLMDRAQGRSVTIDALANALKSRGFRRPPGSPRLITRLRRIKELEISRTGLITLGGGAVGNGAERAAMAGEPLAAEEAQPVSEPAAPVPEAVVVEEAEGEEEGPQPGNERAPSPATEAAPRRRSRRGGRRRRGPRPAHSSR